MDGAVAAWHRYWHDFETERLRVVALRVLFFGLIAFDLWSVTLEHASRYGAGGFNVAQIGILDEILPLPNPAIVATGWLLGGYFALRAAFGIAIRQSIIGATVCYFGIYLWSQVDSYQHHYLVGLLLTLACFIPEEVWTATRPDDMTPERWHRVRHWGLRLIYVQVAIMYFWTGVTKADPTWLSGATMDQLTNPPEIRDMIRGWEVRAGLRAGEGYAWAAAAVLLGELFAPICFLWRRLWIVGLIVVPWFHVGVEILEFDIEWFSYYMIGLDVILLLPDRGWAALRGLAMGVEPLWQRVAVARPTEGGPRMLIAAVTAAACAGVAWRIPVEGSSLLATLVGVATLLALWPIPALAPKLPVYAAVMQVVIAGAMSVTAAKAESLYDMYRLWGGDLRRRGDLEEAAEKYALANAAMPDRPARRFQLAEIYQELGRRDEATALFIEALDVQRREVEARRTATHREPTDAQLFFDLAEDQLRLADRCAAVKRLPGQAVEDMARCERQAVVEAGEAVEKGRKLAPRDRRGVGLERQVERARR
ncbi:MAG: HTTM domain-containing protein [bacterium]